MLHPGAILENGATSEDGAVFSVIRICKNTGGAELHIMKRLQEWSHFGSTFFLSKVRTHTLSILTAQSSRRLPH